MRLLPARITPSRRPRTARRTRPDRDPAATATVRAAAAHCLRYPDDAFHQALPLLRRATAELPATHAEAAAQLGAFLAHAAAADPLDLAAHYVETFDRRNRRSLHLTWWAHGDTRNRGAALVELKARYRAHGLEFQDEDLPDHLPAVLEFAAATGTPGTALLTEHRRGLDALHASLTRCGTPYTGPLRAVLTTLPGGAPPAAAPATATEGPR